MFYGRSRCYLHTLRMTYKLCFSLEFTIFYRLLPKKSHTLLCAETIFQSNWKGGGSWVAHLFAMLWAESSGWWVPHVHLRFLSRYLTLRQTDEVLRDQPLVFIAWRLLSGHKNLNWMWNRNRSETWIKAQVMSLPSERRIKRELMTGWASGQRMEVWPVF